MKMMMESMCRQAALVEQGKIDINIGYLSAVVLCMYNFSF